MWTRKRLGNRILLIPPKFSNCGCPRARENPAFINVNHTQECTRKCEAAKMGLVENETQGTSSACTSNLTWVPVNTQVHVWCPKVLVRQPKCNDISWESLRLTSLSGLFTVPETSTVQAHRSLACGSGLVSEILPKPTTLLVVYLQPVFFSLLTTPMTQLAVDFCEVALWAFTSTIFTTIMVANVQGMHDMLVNGFRNVCLPVNRLVLCSNLCILVCFLFISKYINLV